MHLQRGMNHHLLKTPPTFQKDPRNLKYLPRAPLLNLVHSSMCHQCLVEHQHMTISELVCGRPSRGPPMYHHRRLGGPPMRHVFHLKRGQRTYRTCPQPPHRLGPAHLGPRYLLLDYTQRPSRGPHWNHCRRYGRPPQRDVFHPKTNRWTNRTRPKPPHRLGPPQPGSRFHHLRPSRRPSRGRR